MLSRRNTLKPPTGIVNSRREFWYSVLNMFPFVFLPLVAVLGVLCSLIMPYLTGVASR